MKTRKGENDMIPEKPHNAKEWIDSFLDGPPPPRNPKLNPVSQVVVWLILIGMVAAVATIVMLLVYVCLLAGGLMIGAL